MKLTKRKGFNFFRSYYDVYNELSDKDKVLFMDALLDRQFLGLKPTKLKGMSKFAYISQTNSIDSQVKGYEDKTGLKLTPTVGGCQGVLYTPTEQVQEEVQEEVQDVKQKTKKEKIDGFLKWFNLEKQKHTGKLGRYKMLSKTDVNNLFRLLESYNYDDFKIAIPKMFKNEWAKETNNQTPTHFLRNDNFNKYLNTEIKKEVIGLG